MKKRVLTLLILTTIWGLGSWWYYTCKIKGFCDAANKALNTNITTTASNSNSSVLNAETGLENVSKQVIDSDNDGLTDEEETILSTDPNKKDSDGDGIPDNEEVGSEPSAALDTDQDGKINALDTDDDNDNLPTLLELSIKTNPLEKDSDGDGIDDETEVGNDTKSPLNTDGDNLINAIDPDDDNDGLATIDEVAIGTNPLKADSDGDGINDAEEIGKKTNKPQDSDEDGIIDALDNNDSPQAKVISPKDNQEKPEESKNEETSKEPTIADSTAKKEPAEDEMTIEPIERASNGAIQGSLLYFPFSSAEPKLSKSASKYFKKISAWLKESTDNKITLTGHTDSIGAKSTNHQLGLKRATIIKKMLIKLGAPKAQITANSKGETKPLKTNKTKIGRKKNRRVELTPINK